MYFVITETGALVFDPHTISDDKDAIDTEKEKYNNCPDFNQVWAAFFIFGIFTLL